jgi:hypothetical protein
METMNKVMLLSKRLGDYSRDADPEAYLAADQFARSLFVWRKPVPKFRHSAVNVSADCFSNRICRIEPSDGSNALL